MSGSDWTGLNAWDSLQTHDEDGRVAICFGLAATLYFHDSDEKRRAALECFNEFEHLIGASLRWHCVGANSRRFSPVSKLQSREMSPYMLSKKWNTPEAADQGWAFYWHGGEHPEDASSIKIHAYGSPRQYAEWHNSLSFLQTSVPISWSSAHVQKFLALVQRLCALLKPCHGYSGITLLESPDRGLAQCYSPEIASVAFQHPGIEVDQPMSHKLATQEGIKGGNWLTVLSTRLVERLGGVDHVQTKLGDPFVVTDYGEGILIIAGPVPEVGDRDLNLDTPLYRKLAAMLKPIRIQDHPPPYSEGRFAEDGVFASWLARFDHPHLSAQPK
jgi:hypothetical protein